MPIVNILVAREGTTPGANRTTADQKATVYEGIADLLFNVMGKPREDTTVIFHEHEIEDISQGGVPLEIYRQRRREKATGDDFMSRDAEAKPDEKAHRSWLTRSKHF